MNAARWRISGEGDFENGWNRLLAFNKGRPVTSGISAVERPVGVGSSIGSFLGTSPREVTEDAARLGGICRETGEGS